MFSNHARRLAPLTGLITARLQSALLAYLSQMRTRRQTVALTTTDIDHPSGRLAPGD